ncbi:hypothetical protein KKG83_06665 [Candidatus Micrarchaeota archaeon]|nr:hypothetical protein [Candidatus Micrarchaeota archaeon]MBU2477125.1 hypothetical protein [Candidatus Micrarchaeota archaeon]
MEKILIKKESKIKTLLLLIAGIILFIYEFWVTFEVILTKDYGMIIIEIIISVILLILVLAATELIAKAYLCREFICVSDKVFIFLMESKIPFLKKERFIPFDLIEKVSFEKNIFHLAEGKEKDKLDKIKDFIAEDMVYFRVYPKKGTEAEKIKSYGITTKVPFYTYQITSEKAELIKKNLKDKVKFS